MRLISLLTWIRRWRNPRTKVLAAHLLLACALTTGAQAKSVTIRIRADDGRIEFSHRGTRLSEQSLVQLCAAAHKQKSEIVFQRDKMTANDALASILAEARCLGAKNVSPAKTTPHPGHIATRTCQTPAQSSSAIAKRSLSSPAEQKARGGRDQVVRPSTYRCFSRLGPPPFALGTRRIQPGDDSLCLRQPALTQTHATPPRRAGTPR